MKQFKVNSKISKRNLNEYCRTCLSACKDEGYDVQALSPPLFRLFKECSFYKNSQKISYPNFLCSVCYETLKNFQAFRLAATRSTEFIAEILKAEALEDTHEEEKTFSSKREAASQVSPTEQSKQLRNFEEILIESTAEIASDDCEFSSELSITSQSNDRKSMETHAGRKDTLTVLLNAEKKTFPKTRLYKCPHCKRSYHYSYYLSKHLTEDHNMKPTLIACQHEKCKNTFKHHETAAQHYKLKHEHNLKVIKPRDTTCICEDCGRTFKSEQKLRDHRYQHKPVDARPFHCDQCDKHFITKRHYNEHQLRHAGIKAYECSYCGLKQTSARELRAHINHHTKEKQYPCPLCSRVFSRAANLNIHDRVVHKGIRSHKCRFCDQSFGKPDTLKHHEMRHTGEKPHKCKVCDRGFIQPAALKAHEKTHNKKRMKKKDVNEED